MTSKRYLLINLDDRMLEEWRNGGKHAAMYVGDVQPASDRHYEPYSTLSYPDVLQHTTKQVTKASEQSSMSHSTHNRSSWGQNRRLKLSRQLLTIRLLMPSCTSLFDGSNQ